MVTQKSPEVRFEGFTEDWELQKLEELAEIVRGASPRPIKDPKWFESSSDVGWLRISDVTAQDGKIKHLSQRISKAGQEKTRVLETPHLLLSIAASVGKPVINFVKTGVHDGFLIFLNPQFEQNFLFHWMKMFEPKWQVYGQPGSQVNLNSDIVKTHEILIPKSNEQEKVGEYFKNLYKLIENHQHQLTKLQNLKKAMLVKLFPQMGTTVPEIRFKGFDGEWESLFLGDVVDITMGQSPKGSNYTDNPTDYILVQGNADIENGRVKPRLWTTQVTKTAKKGDIIFSVRAPVGDLAKTDYDIVIGRGVSAIRGNEFVFQTLLRAKDQGYWQRFSAGSTFESINSNELKNAKFMFPSILEQQRIGEYFKNLDSLITNHKEQLKKLNNIKKACLSKLFVA